MTGKTRLLEQIAKETDLSRLEAAIHNFHGLADLAAIDDLDRDWKDYCELESACQKRVKELKEKGETK